MTNDKAYSSTLPLDMGQLDAITEGKNTFQEELLEVFFSNVSECLNVMEKNCQDGECETWKDAAQEMKDISDSLGALELSKVCAVAQKIYNSSEDEKKKMLATVRSNVNKLRVFVKSTRYQ